MITVITESAPERDAPATHQQNGGHLFRHGPDGHAEIKAWGRWVKTDWTNSDLDNHPWFSPLPPEGKPS